MKKPRRIAPTTLRVIAQFWNARGLLSSPALAAATALPPSQIHQILKRLVKAGWLNGEWEADEQRRERGGPRLLLYCLTDRGWRETRPLRQQHAILVAGKWLVAENAMRDSAQLRRDVAHDVRQRS